MKATSPVQSSETAARKRRPLSCWWVLCGLAAVPLLMLGLLAAGVAGCFRLGSDARALRDSAAKATASKLDRNIELSAGWLPLSLVRAGLSLADLDPVARAALETVRGADVGVYELGRQERPLHSGAVLAAADKMMAKHGLDRVVGVASQAEVVGVYVPAAARSGHGLRVCVLVLEARQLVVVSARANVEPLVELAMRQAALGRRCTSIPTFLAAYATSRVQSP
jgi:hypothetical protein